MYPFANCSLTNLASDSLSPCVIGYILQSIEAGASGSRSIVWSHVLFGGNLCDISSLNTFRYLWYSFGTISSKVRFVLSAANWANSEATVVFRRVTLSDSSSELASQPTFLSSRAWVQTFWIATYSVVSGSLFLISHSSSMIALNTCTPVGFIEEMMMG